MNILTFQECPRCGGKLHWDKTTFTGEEIREYYCPDCKWQETINNGPALWQILSDARQEQSERGEATRQLITDNGESGKD
jgi:ssDNA-binding Zn-finger/Zn-ribbon topoisomerase 1